MPAYLNYKGSPVRDRDWVANMFMVSIGQIEQKYQFMMHNTTAHNKYTDTRIGGNWAINMPPAFTRFADPRQSSLNQETGGDTRPRGMGQLYSEMIDDNTHLVHKSFGGMSHRGMVSFFVGMGDVQAALYARLGKVPLTFLIGKVAGIYTSMRFLPLLLIGTAGNFLLNRGSSKYYSFRPMMHAYWKRVDFIANTIAVSIGLYQKPDSIEWGNRELEKLDGNFASQAEYTRLVDIAYKSAPEVFRKRGGVDVYRLATRTQRMANARRKLLEDHASKITSTTDIYNFFITHEYRGRRQTDDAKNSLENLLQIHTTEYGDPAFVEDGGLDNRIVDAIESSQANGFAAQDYSGGGEIATANASNPTESTTTGEGQVSPNTDGWANQASSPTDSLFPQYRRDPTNEGEVIRKEGWLNGWWDNLKANYDGAFEWVSFRVQHTGSISSSFSNSTKEADISSMINGFSSTMAGHRFTFSNGQTGIGLIDSAISGVANMLRGYVSGLDAAGIINLAGSAYVDIPEHWESSSASFPSESFKMELRTPYANKLSRFMDLYIPLAMILAGALPISTGRQQYTSPFLCQVISPGRMSCKLGIIEQLSVGIGTGNIGYNQRNQPLGFDVSWSVKDMNKTLHAPIDTGASMLNPLRSIFDDDNAFNDYLNVISAVSMADQIIPTRKFSRNVAIRLNQWDSFWSVGNWTMGALDSSLGRGVKNLVTIGGLAGVPGVTVPQLDRSTIQ